MKILGHGVDMCRCESNFWVTLDVLGFGLEFFWPRSWSQVLGLEHKVLDNMTQWRSQDVGVSGKHLGVECGEVVPLDQEKFSQ